MAEYGAELVPDEFAPGVDIGWVEHEGEVIPLLTLRLHSSTTYPKAGWICVTAPAHFLVAYAGAVERAGGYGQALVDIYNELVRDGTWTSEQALEMIKRLGALGPTPGQ